VRETANGLRLPDAFRHESNAMTRIRLLQTNELEPDIAADCLQFEAVTGDSSGWRALAHRPDLLRLLRGFYTPLQFEGLLSRKLIELVRLGIAQINQCQNCLLTRYPDSIEDGLTEELVRALPDAQASPLFTEREKAAIEFGQKMARNHFSIGDEDFIRLHLHFSEQEVVELCLDVAMFVGLGRLFATIDARNTVCVIPAATKTAQDGGTAPDVRAREI
jgi:alkylhydroperoxidase family enzyme